MVANLKNLGRNKIPREGIPAPVLGGTIRQGESTYWLGAIFGHPGECFTTNKKKLACVLTRH